MTDLREMLSSEIYGGIVRFPCNSMAFLYLTAGEFKSKLYHVTEHHNFPVLQFARIARANSHRSNSNAGQWADTSIL